LVKVFNTKNRQVAVIVFSFFVRIVPIAVPDYRVVFDVLADIFQGSRVTDDMIIKSWLPLKFLFCVVVTKQLVDVFGNGRFI